MLKNIFLIVTNEYKGELLLLPEYSVFIEEMHAQDVQVTMLDTEEAENDGVLEQIDWEESLFLSDDEKSLNWIQGRNGYTVALYHDGVGGVLSGTQFAIEEIAGVEWDYLYKVYQRFRKEPWQITRTKRCLIREMGVEDVEALYELYNSPLVVRYTEPLYEEKEKEEQYIKDYIENIYKYYGFGTWLIIRKEDGKLIGRAGFNYRPGFEEVELGFVIGEPFWRMGYAYEVCSHLMELGKMVYEFEKVQALVRTENEASKRLLEKLGFHYVNEVVLEGQNYERFVSKLAI